MWQFNFVGFFDKSRITKCEKAILLQRVASVNIKCVRYCKAWQFVITKYAMPGITTIDRL